MHGAGRQPQVGGERAHAPAAVMFRLLARPALHFLQDFLTILRGPSRTSCILQAIQTLAGETTAPLTYRNFGNLKGAGDLLIGLSRSRGQDNATAQRQRLGSRC